MLDYVRVINFRIITTTTTTTAAAAAAAAITIICYFLGSVFIYFVVWKLVCALYFMSAFVNNRPTIHVVLGLVVVFIQSMERLQETTVSEVAYVKPY